jgi:hypothetical protein
MAFIGSVESRRLRKPDRLPEIIAQRCGSKVYRQLGELVSQCPVDLRRICGGGLPSCVCQYLNNMHREIDLLPLRKLGSSQAVQPP